MAKMTLAQQAKEILRIAEEYNAQSNYLFVTTFNRYMMQLQILDGLEKSIKGEGLLVTKEYVKGRGNLYTNPAVSEYNRTTDSANKTVATLMKVLKNFNVGEDKDEDVDPLMSIINGGADEEQ